MLPFLKNKQAPGISSLLVKQRTPDEKPQDSETIDKNANIEACARDLINAVQANDAMAVAEALRSAFVCLESEPHEEYEQPEGQD